MNSGGEVSFSQKAWMSNTLGVGLRGFLIQVCWLFLRTDKESGIPERSHQKTITPHSPCTIKYPAFILSCLLIVGEIQNGSLQEIAQLQKNKLKKYLFACCPTIKMPSM